MRIMKKTLREYGIHLFIGLFFVLYGCTTTQYPKKLAKSRIPQVENSYATIKGTLTILLPDKYDRKRVKKLFKLDSRTSANIVFTDDKTKKLFVFNYFESERKALKDFFNKVKQTGFYDENKHIEPVFKVVFQGIKKPPRKWGLNSGWQKITKDPYQPYAFILKKVVWVGVTKRRVPHDCYSKGIPCM